MSDSPWKFVCSQCGAINRVPSTRLNEGPICGRCKQPLIPRHPVELNDTNFQRFISETSAPVLVDFWAAWCGPCRMMAPAFAEAAGLLAPKMILAKLDTDAAARTASQFQISGIPCLILFHRGVEIRRQAGAMNAAQIVKWATAPPTVP